jgi:hypothetical protein
MIHVKNSKLRTIVPYLENIRTPNESAMYKIIIRGSAANFNIANNNTLSARKVNLTLLSDQLKFSNFKAKRSILETSNREKTTVMILNTTGLKTTSSTGEFKKGSEVMKNVFAGVGRPLNECDCDSSRLKMAKRNAEQTAMSKAIYGKYEKGDSREIAVYM